MSIKHRNPPPVFQTNVFTQMVEITADSLLIISGQVALDQAGNVVGEGDLRAQTRQVFENLRLILAAIGADFSQVVKLTIYVVNYQYEDRFALMAVQGQFMKGIQPPASTLIGVQSLARPGLLIEVEATAVLPQSSSST